MTFQALKCLSLRIIIYITRPPCNIPSGRVLDLKNHKVFLDHERKSSRLKVLQASCFSGKDIVIQLTLARDFKNKCHWWKQNPFKSSLGCMDLSSDKGNRSKRPQDKTPCTKLSRQSRNKSIKLRMKTTSHDKLQVTSYKLSLENNNANFSRTFFHCCPVFPQRSVITSTVVHPCTHCVPI